MLTRCSRRVDTLQVQERCIQELREKGLLHGACCHSLLGCAAVNGPVQHLTGQTYDYWALLPPGFEVKRHVTSGLRASVLHSVLSWDILTRL